jgi:hypothetical protein
LDGNIGNFTPTRHAKLYQESRLVRQKWLAGLKSLYILGMSFIIRQYIGDLAPQGFIEGIV